MLGIVSLAITDLMMGLSLLLKMIKVLTVVYQCRLLVCVVCISKCGSVCVSVWHCRSQLLLGCVVYIFYIQL